jgi:WD40 repeat protein/serine/threonine protein kinase
MNGPKAPTVQPFAEGDIDPILADWAASAVEDLLRKAPIDLEFYRNQDPVRASRLERFLAEVRETDLAAVPNVLERHGVGPIPWPQVSGLEIVRLMGRSDAGLVFEARQHPFGQRVRLKVLPRANFLQPGRLRRLEIETVALSRLRSPFLVPIHEVHLDAEFPHIIMGFIDGSTLADEMWRARLDRDTSGIDPASSSRLDPRTPAGITAIVHCLRQAAAGLGRAHELGLLHRDLKPSNLLVDTRGETCLVDFGMSLVGGGESGMSGDPLSGFRYMPPELIAGTSESIDRRTDVYALGAILYEALALRPAFDQTDRLALFEAVSRHEPPRLRRLNRTVSADLETIVSQAMAKDPSRRYADASRLGDDLERLLDGQPIHARRPTPLDHCRTWLGRHQRVVGSTVGAAIGLCLIASLTLAWVNATLRDSLERQERSITAYQLQEAQRQFDRGQLETALQVLDSTLDPPSARWSPRFSAALLRDMIGHDVRLLRGHQHWVIGACVTDDGQTLATGDIRGTLLVRRLADLAIVAEFPSIERPILKINASAGGSRVLVQVGEHRAWETITGLRVGNLEDGTWSVSLAAPVGETIAGLALYAGGTRAAVASIDPDTGWNLRFWNLAQGGTELEPERIERYAHGWVDERSGGFVAIEASGTIHARRFDDPGPGWSHPAIPEAITAAAQSYDGNWVAIGDRVGRVRLCRLDGTAPDEVWDSHRGLVQKLWFNRTGNQVVSLSAADGVAIRDRDQARVRTVALAQPGEVIDAELDELGQRLVAVTPYGREVLRLWDLTAGRLISSYPGQNAVPFRSMFLPDGAVLLYGAGDPPRAGTRYGNLLRIWQPQARGPRLELLHESEVWSTWFTRDGRSLITGSDDTGNPRTLRRWNLATGELEWGVEAADAMVAATAIDPAERVVAAAILGEQGRVKLFDMATGAELRTLVGHVGRVWEVVFAPDGRSLVSAGTDRAIHVWDPLTGQEVRRLTGHNLEVRALAFRPDGRWLASGGDDGFVMLWSLPDGSRLRQLAVPDTVRDLAFSPDGRILAGALENGVLQVWDAATGAILHRIYSGEGQLNALAFNIDGQEIAAAGLSGLIRIWDTQSGQELLHLSEDDGIQVNSLAFRSDGQALVSGDHKGRVRLWKGSSSANPPAVPPGDSREDR